MRAVAIRHVVAAGRGPRGTVGAYGPRRALMPTCGGVGGGGGGRPAGPWGRGRKGRQREDAMGDGRGQEQAGNG